MRLLALLLVAMMLAMGQALAGQPATSSTAPKPAQKTTAPAAERFGDWDLICPDAKEKTKPASCSLAQQLVDANSKRTVFRLSVGYGPRGNLILIVNAPLGIALPKGLEVTFGGQAVQRVAFDTCRPNGCRAVLILSSELLQEMRQAERVLLTVQTLGGAPFQATASLKGFGNGLNALNKRHTSP